MYFLWNTLFYMYLPGLTLNSQIARFKWPGISGQSSCMCHTHDNQSHPRPKNSPLRLVPLPSRLLQIAESRVTTMHPLRHTASSRVPTTQPRTPQDLARMNTATRDQPCCQPCSPRLAPQHSPSEELAIVTLLYLVPFHLCTLLFSFSAYHCPVPALYLSLCLLHLVV